MYKSLDEALNSGKFDSLLFTNEQQQLHSKLFNSDAPHLKIKLSLNQSIAILSTDQKKV